MQKEHIKEFNINTNRFLTRTLLFPITSKHKNVILYNKDYWELIIIFQ